MHRTQIQLEERQYRYLSNRAGKSGKSLSAQIREMIEEQMQARPDPDDPLWDIVGMAEGDDAPVAREHDKYLYGEPR